jgi:hypothetical protein
LATELLTTLRLFKQLLMQCMLMDGNTLYIPAGRFAVAVMARLVQT